MNIFLVKLVMLVFRYDRLIQGMKIKTEDLRGGISIET